MGSTFPGGSHVSLVGNASTSTTIANVALGEPGAQATSPVAGTVVQWRLNTLGPGRYTLRVLRPAGGGVYSGVAAAPQDVPGSGDQTFATNLPIQAGDLIAVDLPSNPTMSASMGGLVGVQMAGSEWDQRTPPMPDSPSRFFNTNPGSEVQFNALVSYQGSAEPPASRLSAAGCSKKTKKHKRSATAAKKCGKKKRKKK